MFARQNWYCAATADEVRNAPLGRRLVERDVVLFRDEQGRAHAIDAMCAHRGGNLADGRVIASTVECPWHGWRYGGDGKCTEIPSFGTCGKIPKLAKVASYPLHEAQGLLYIWMDPDGKPSWLPQHHEFLDARYHVRSNPRFQQGNYVSTVEAASDDSHVFVAHQNTIGRGVGGALARITDLKEDPDGRAAEAHMAWPLERKRPFTGFDAWLSRTHARDR